MRTIADRGRLLPVLLLTAGVTVMPHAQAEPVVAPEGANDTPAAAASEAEDRTQSRLSRLLKEASLSPGVLDVARLGDVGASESVMLAFVNNSETAYKLRADDIVYLREHAVPDAIVAAMIERGAILRDRQPAPPPIPTVQNIVWNAPQPEPPAITFIPAPVKPEPVSTVTIIGRSDARRGLSQWNHPYQVARPGMWRNNSYSYSFWGGGYSSHSPYARPIYKHGPGHVACR